MRELIFGTKNEAKIKQIGGVLTPIGVKVVGLPDINLPDIEENGTTAVENAIKKAVSYSKILNDIVFSMDNALYLEGLKPSEQPALHVRRLDGYSARPTDNEMISYYSKLIGKLGNKINGYWEYGICVANPDGNHQETVVRAPRIFVSKPSSVIQTGYPLESLQIEPETGKYMSELSQKESDLFWQKTIGKPVLDFIKSINL